MELLHTVAEVRERVRQWRQAGKRVGFVPTMGNLHEGHLSLVREGLARAERVIVTLFVNPRQFNSAADLAAYPRTEVSDAARLESLGGTMVLFAPDGDEMYPPGFSTGVTVTGVSEGLCGAGRPGHFDGVATVVTKLLLISGADAAMFGEKDYQQLQVVRRVAQDLNLPVEIVPFCAQCTLRTIGALPSLVAINVGGTKIGNDELLELSGEHPRCYLYRR